jgi:hypothetical protein
MATYYECGRCKGAFNAHEVSVHYLCDSCRDRVAEMEQSNYRIKTAAENIIAVINAHEIDSIDCDRSGTLICDCLEIAKIKLLDAVNDENKRQCENEKLENDKNKAKIGKLRYLLRNLYALVSGECPSLIDGDRGGDGMLALEIEEELATGGRG